jgi:hypothetical protein
VPQAGTIFFHFGDFNRVFLAKINTFRRQTTIERLYPAFRVGLKRQNFEGKKWFCINLNVMASRYTIGVHSLPHTNKFRVIFLILILKNNVIL